MKRYRLSIVLGVVLVGLIALAQAPFPKGLVIGGGYGSTGITIEDDGDLRMNGNLTVDGTISGSVASGGDALTSSGLDQFAATTSAELAGVITNETGTGALVFGTSPTFTTPNLGTPGAVTLTNGTGLPIGGLAAGSSSALAGVINDETGSGVLVFGTSPTLTTPNLGTPSAVTLTNGTGLPLGGIVNIAEARLLGRAVGAGAGATTELTTDQVVQFLYKKTTLTSGATPTWTCTDGIKFKLTLGHNATIQAASGTPFDGRPAEFLIIQDGSSAYTCAFATGSSKAFVAGDDFSNTIPAVSSTLSSKSYYKFEYDSGTDRFVLMATAVS